MAVITGNSTNQTLSGTANDDTIDGRGGTDTLLGGFGNDTLDGGTGADRMEGGIGADTYYIDNTGDVIADVEGGGASTVITKISLTTLHNTVYAVTMAGTGGIDVFGSNYDNDITGNSGNNTLAGRGGFDWLRGGLGNDSYVIAIGDEADMVEELEGEGTDTILSEISYTLGTNVEKLTLLDGGAQVDGTGNELANVITGNSYNNTLDGAEGADTLAGGGGDDTFIVDIENVAGVTVLQDKVKEKDGEGTDTLFLRGYSLAAETTLTLGANIENLDASATFDTALHLTGNALGNTLTGNDYGNTLFGKKGDDKLMGGYGDDTYRFVQGDGFDTIIDTGGADKIRFGSGINAANTTYAQSGNDLIIRYGTQGDVVRVKDYFSQPEVEEIVFNNGTVHDYTHVFANLSTFATAGDDLLTGTSGRDFLDGLDGADTILGLGGDDYLVSGNFYFGESLYGGDGNDIIEASAYSAVVDGGAGNDTIYFEGSPVDTTVTGGDGIDTLVTSAPNGLADYADIENLHLWSGSYALGNALDNVITVADTGVTLDGGAGADTLVGHGGDTFIVDNENDVVIAGNGGANDVIISTVSWDLHKNGNVEELTLAGDDSIDATGNGLANIIVGNTGDNTLDGGEGADVMYGGGGNDSYVVDDVNDFVEGGAGIDTIYASVYYEFYSSGIENLTLTGADDISASGNEEDNTLTGNSGNNTLRGGGFGEDLLIGGAGDDTLLMESQIATLEGGAGNDVYQSHFGGGGTFIIDDVQGSNTLSLEDSAEYVRYSQNGDDLIVWVDYGSPFDSKQIVVRDFFSGTGHIDTVSLAGGTTHDTAYVLSHLVEQPVVHLTGGDDYYEATGERAIVDGGDGNDTILGAGTSTLYGGAGNDTLIGVTSTSVFNGGTGNDLLLGSLDRDTYIFTTGDGHDRIEDSGFKDKILFSEGVAPESVSYGWYGADLVISYGDGDTVAVANFLTDPAQRIERVVFDDGTEHDLAYILSQLPENLQVLTEGNDEYFGTTGNDVADGWDGDDFMYGDAGNDYLQGADGDDFLDGHTGNDTLEGGKGNDWLSDSSRFFEDGGDDTYVFSAGDGTDAIEENLFSSGDDTILFRAGVEAGDVTYYDDNMGSLIISYGEGDNITVYGFFQTEYRQIEHVVFHDNTEHDLAYILSHLFTAPTGTEGDDVLAGGIFADSIEGLGGNDTISGKAGDDSLSGGDGNDTLDGGAGADFLSGGSDDDSFIIDADDAVDGGGGSDTIYAAGGTLYLDNYTDVENIVLTGAQEGYAVGNGGDNYIRANASGFTQVEGAGGNDTLEAGSARSVLYGGDGDDVFYTHNADDEVYDYGGTAGGIDTIYADNSVFVAEVEHIFLTGSGDYNVYVWGASDPVTITGNSGSNSVNGGYGDDVLDGAGGADTLDGSSGADTFLFREATAYDASDSIANFESYADRIDISDLLSGFDPMTMALADFVSVTEAEGNTLLSVDADGAGSGTGFVQVASILLQTGFGSADDMVTAGQLVVQA